MDRVALVTGGSGGIGGAICMALAQDGFNICVHYNNNESAAEQVCEQIRALGHKAVATRADLSGSDGCIKLVESCIESLGGLYALVNNAGITDDGLIMRMTNEQYQNVMRTNLDSCFFCTRASAPYLLKKRAGRIVNITSVVGITGNAGQANYAAAKAGMIGLTKSCAREFAKRGVCVNAVAPGFIETAMTDRLDDDVKQRMKDAIPQNRFGRAEDVANMVAFLCGDKAAYITGQVLAVDGGMTI